MKSTVLSLLFAATLAAQVVPVPPVTRPAPRVQELRAYLTLTDAQVQQLTQLQQTRAAEVQRIYEQIRQKEQQLQQAITAGGANPTTVGQLYLDIQTLRRSLTPNTTANVDGARAILTPEQRTRLNGLIEAQRLQPVVSQALSLGLLAPASGVITPRFDVLESLGGPALHLDRFTVPLIQ